MSESFLFGVSLRHDSKGEIEGMGTSRQERLFDTAGTVASLVTKAQKLSTYEPVRIHK